MCMCMCNAFMSWILMNRKIIWCFWSLQPLGLRLLSHKKFTRIYSRLAGNMPVEICWDIYPCPSELCVVNVQSKMLKWVSSIMMSDNELVSVRMCNSLAYTFSIYFTSSDKVKFVKRHWLFSDQIVRSKTRADVVKFLT